MIWSIRERRAFEQLARRGSRIRTSTLWCTYLLDPAASPPRVAFSIGRNVGRAVLRNRLRRQLRAAMVTLEFPAGWFLVGARPTTVELTFAARATELRQLLAKLPASGAATANTPPRERR